MNLETNQITKDDRTFRIILGSLIVLGTIFGLGTMFFFMLGGLTIASGAMGLCVIKSLFK